MSREPADDQPDQIERHPRGFTFTEESTFEIPRRLLVFRHRLDRIIGLICMLFFALCSLIPIFNEQAGGALCFSPFILLGATAFLLSGDVEMDFVEVRHLRPFAREVIRWDELREIEIGIGTMILHGQDKQMRLIEPGGWLQADAQFMQALTLYKTRELHIPVRRNPWCEFQFSKNVREKAPR